MWTREGLVKQSENYADFIYGWSLVVWRDLVHGEVVLAVWAVDVGVGQVPLLVHVVDEVLGKVLLDLAAGAPEHAPAVVLLAVDVQPAARPAEYLVAPLALGEGVGDALLVVGLDLLHLEGGLALRAVDERLVCVVLGVHVLEQVLGKVGLVPALDAPEG